MILPTRKRVRSSPLALSEARRAWNRDRIGLVSDLRCECTRPSCRGRVPAVAESHRRDADQFVVAPAHFDDGIVVRAADRFFVVESRGHVIACSPRKKRRVSSLELARSRVDLTGTAGFLVADARGRVVGQVEGPMYGASPEIPDVLSVRSSLLRWRRRLVPADAIEAIDEQTRVIGLRIERAAIKAFL